MCFQPLTAIALSCTAAAGPAWQISSGLTQPAQAAQGTPGGRRRASLFTRTSADHGKPDGNSPRLPSGTPVLQRARASSYAGQNFGWSGVRSELFANEGLTGCMACPCDMCRPCLVTKCMNQALNHSDHAKVAWSCSNFTAVYSLNHIVQLWMLLPACCSKARA